MNGPIGDLCVMKTEDQKSWVVSVCRGNGTRDELRHFPTRVQAVEFAIAEREWRRKADGLALDLHVPDGCPCSETPVKRDCGKTRV